MTRVTSLRMACGILLLVCILVYGAVTGSISGTLRDQTGAVIPGAMITVTNSSQGIQNKTNTDAKGFYSFPILSVGRYDLQFEAPGFRPQKRTGVTIDTDSAVTVDAPTTPSRVMSV